jgi:hypothetical protein
VTDLDATLLELIRAAAPAEGVEWLQGALAGVADGTQDLAVVFPGVARRVGRGGLGSGATVGGVPLAAWRVDDAARAALLLAAARRFPDGAFALAVELYRHGDAREKTGALRALALLPAAPSDPAGLPAILDAMRTSQGEIFEAAILDNPYASWHLPQHEWHKAVLKTVFVGQPVDRIVRIDERADAALAQSLLEFAEEREAATRAVPPDIWRIASLHPPRGLAAKLLGYLEHPAPEQRRGAAAGLAVLAGADPRLRPFLDDRLDRERDETVRAMLRTQESR